jgi:acetyl esterase/lipase
MSQSILNRTPPPADDRIAYGDGELHFADLRLPPGRGPHPCAIGIHGGFWRNLYNLDHFGHACAALTERGVATWSIEYRRIGDPGGGWPGTFNDVAAAAAHVFDHAGEFEIDPARIVVIGHSAGGHLASWLASMASVPDESPIRAEPLDLRGAAPLAGLLDLRMTWAQQLGSGAVVELLGGTPEEAPDRYSAASPFTLAPSIVPHVVVHGSDDVIVPARMSARYQAAASKRGGRVSLNLLRDAGHFDVIDPESSGWPEIADAVLGLVGMND